MPDNIPNPAITLKRLEIEREQARLNIHQYELQILEKEDDIRKLKEGRNIQENSIITLTSKIDEIGGNINATNR